MNFPYRALHSLAALVGLSVLANASELYFDTAPTALPDSGTYTEAGMNVLNQGGLSDYYGVNFFNTGPDPKTLYLGNGDVLFSLQSGANFNLTSFDYLTNGYSYSGLRWITTSTGHTENLTNYGTTQYNNGMWFSTQTFSGPNFTNISWFLIGVGSNLAAGAGNFDPAEITNVKFAAVPEPAPIAAFGVGALGLIVRRRRK